MILESRQFARDIRLYASQFVSRFNMKLVSCPDLGDDEDREISINAIDEEMWRPCDWGAKCFGQICQQSNQLISR